MTVEVIAFGGKSTQDIGAHKKQSFKCAHHKCNIKITYGTKSGALASVGTKNYNRSEAGTYFLGLIKKGPHMRDAFIRQTTERPITSCDELTDEDYGVTDDTTEDSGDYNQ